MSAMVSETTGVSVVYAVVYSCADQRKHQSSVSLAFCEGNSPVTDEFPAQRVSNAENVSIWWRHHGSKKLHSENFTVVINGGIVSCQIQSEKSFHIPHCLFITVVNTWPSNRPVPQMRAPLAVCHELALDYNTEPKRLYAFEHET